MSDPVCGKLIQGLWQGLSLRSSNCTQMWGRIEERHLAAQRPNLFRIFFILFQINTIFAYAKLSNLSPLLQRGTEICEANLVISSVSSRNSPRFHLFSLRGLNSLKATWWISTHIYMVTFYLMVFLSSTCRSILSIDLKPITCEVPCSRVSHSGLESVLHLTHSALPFWWGISHCAEDCWSTLSTWKDSPAAIPLQGTLRRAQMT